MSPSCCPNRSTAGWPKNCARLDDNRENTSATVRRVTAALMVISLALGERAVQRLLRLGDRGQNLGTRLGEFRLLRVRARPGDGPRQSGKLDKSPTDLDDIAELCDLSEPRVDAFTRDALPRQHIGALLGQGGHPVADRHEAATRQVSNCKLDNPFRGSESAVGRLRNALHNLRGVSRPVEQQGGGADHHALARLTEAVPTEALPTEARSAPAVPTETRATEA